MVESLPIMVDTHIKEQVKKQVPEQVRDQVLVYVAEGLILERQKTKEEMERMIAKAILQERGNIQAEISSQILKAIDNHIPSRWVNKFIKTYWELGHEHKFITEIVARRANECIVSIIEPDYKNLNKNYIEDMYLLIMMETRFKELQYAVSMAYVQRRTPIHDEVEYLKLFEEEIEVLQPYEKMGDVCKWKTTWTTKGKPE
ncbi:hypothetical protein Tco_1448103 [Tanacetum coccineum]